MSKLRLLVIKTTLFIYNNILKHFKKALFKNMDGGFLVPTKYFKILILRNGSMGDSIASLPAIYNIRKNFPMADISILYNNGGNNLVSIESLIDHKLINNFINYHDKTKRELIQQFKNKSYDLFIELPQAHQPFTSYIRNILFAKFYVKATYAFGWHMYHSRLFPRTQAKYCKITNVREMFLASLQREGLKIVTQDAFPLGISSEIKENVWQLIASTDAGINKANTIGMVVGAKRPQNRWPTVYFDVIIEYLIEQQYQIVLFGGKEDTLIAKQLTNYYKCIDFTGKLKPLESAELMKYCKLMITNDTGPMHLAYAVGVYTVALFSSRDYPNLWFPPEKMSTVFRNNDVFCSECFTETCDNNVCMQAILPTQVIQVLKQKLHITD